MAKRYILGYESKHQPLLSRRAFAGRLAGNFTAASVLIGVSLLGGMVGYHYLEGMDWIDAFVNAAMILSGMGPVGQLQTWGGKLFAGFYARIQRPGVYPGHGSASSRPSCIACCIDSIWRSKRGNERRMRC